MYNIYIMYYNMNDNRTRDPSLANCLYNIILTINFWNVLFTYLNYEYIGDNKILLSFLAVCSTLFRRRFNGRAVIYYTCRTQWYYKLLHTYYIFYYVIFMHHHCNIICIFNIFKVEIFKAGPVLKPSTIGYITGNHFINQTATYNIP